MQVVSDDRAQGPPQTDEKMRAEYLVPDVVHCTEDGTGISASKYPDSAECSSMHPCRTMPHDLKTWQASILERISNFASQTMMLNVN